MQEQTPFIQHLKERGVPTIEDFLPDAPKEQQTNPEQQKQEVLRDNSEIYQDVRKLNLGFSHFFGNNLTLQENRERLPDILKILPNMAILIETMSDGPEKEECKTWVKNRAAAMKNYLLQTLADQIREEVGNKDTPIPEECKTYAEKIFMFLDPDGQNSYQRIIDIDKKLHS